VQQLTVLYSAVTLCQPVMFVVDKVAEEDYRILFASELEPITS
jgi:hypothetical protein